jgi:hypothetical protein
MSNRYQVKYYLDDKELTSNNYKDDNYYASNATSRALELEIAQQDINAKLTDEQLKALMDKNIKNIGTSEVYKPADSKRFDFETYKYVVNTRDNKFTAAKVPDIPAGKRFSNVKWQIKDANGNVIAEVSPEKLASISENVESLEEYFNALTSYAYKNNEDYIYTFHLHLYTEEALEEPNVSPSNVEPSETNPLTLDSISANLLLFLVSLMCILLIVLRKTKKAN